MSLRPSAIVETSAGGLYVAIDDPDTEGVLLIPCSFAHRQVVPAVPLGSTIHPSQMGITAELEEQS